MNGFINVYKEKGYTSHDVVAKMRGILKIKKIGHTGTLDPEAEGVLPVCIGKATKLASMITEGIKGYETTLRFGKTTTTADHTGDTVEEYDFVYNPEAVKEAVDSFVGEIMQVPPMYSAIKVNGRRLYELAREGKVIEREPRAITIYRIDLIEHLPPDAVRLRIICSKGTYIRALCHDIGDRLGYGGHMDGLLRINSGHFDLAHSHRLGEIEKLKVNNQLDQIFLGFEDVLKDYKQVSVVEAKDKFLLNGNIVFFEDLQTDSNTILLDDIVRIYTSKGQFVGLYIATKKNNRLCLKPHKILL
ncbi:tRNA pseudouridine(55) synthase TruB [Vallitalea okinawensis]|uniref:tRNA pseudouridine(55) synthase TruB n=1 Tax=Vallitalea okinawensis TaxID=2078660 RepID=UPI000CFCD98D|nr:tRNA pseudouridine(55) synthase TruB [Vallitalea okinawensis]